MRGCGQKRGIPKNTVCSSGNRLVASSFHTTPLLLSMTSYHQELPRKEGRKRKRWMDTILIGMETGTNTVDGGGRTLL